MPLGLPSDTSVIVQPGKNGLSCSEWELSLSCDALLPKKCRIHILKDGNTDV